MSTIRVVNIQHSDATEPNIVLNADGTTTFVSGITISGGTNLTVSGTAEFASGTVSAPGITFIDDNNTGIYEPAADTVAITTAATERLRVDSLGIVKIGTENASSAIALIGSSSNTNFGQLQFQTSSQFLIGYGSTHSVQPNQLSLKNNVGDLTFYTDGDERLKITSTGSAEFKGSVLGSNIDVSSSSGKNGWKLSGSSSTDLTGKLELQCKTGAASSTKVFEVFNGSTSTSSIAKDGSATFTGNVGIGGTATGNFGAIDKGVLITGSDAQVGLRVHTSNGSSGILEIYAENGGSMLDTRGSGHIRVGSAATEFMRIDSSGRVGIGTSSPDEKLVVADVAASSGFSQTSVKALRSNYGGQISGYIDQGVGHGLTFSTVDSGTASERMRIDSSGRLLVGTPSFTGEASAVLEGSSAGGTTQAQLWLNRGSTPTTDNVLGQIIFGDNNAAGRNGAMIQARADLSWNTNDYPSRLAFFTTGDGASSPAERMRITSDGNVKVINQHLRFNTTGKGIIFGTDGGSNRPSIIGNYTGSSDNNIVFNVTGSERVRIDSSGSLLVGTTAAYSSDDSLVIQKTDAGAGIGLQHSSTGQVTTGKELGRISFYSNDGDLNSSAEFLAAADSNHGVGDKPGRLVFSTTADGASSPTERMRIGSNGYNRIFAASSVFVAMTGQGAGTTYSLIDGNHSATSIESANGTNVFKVWSNGNVQNTNNSYTALSDIKLKENIANANSQWDDIKSLQVRNYNLKKGQTHRQIGLVAQEVEPISPGLVYESPDRDAEGNDLGTTTKSVNYSVLYMKAVKALQEAMERIETLEASNNDLLARVTALEGA